MKFLLAVFILQLSPLCFGYYTLNTNIGANFAQDNVNINVASNSCDNLGRTPADLLHLVTIAVDRYWNTVSTSRLYLLPGQIKDVSTNFKTDEICSSTTSSGSCNTNPDLIVDRDILIACNNNTTNFPDGAILGLTVPNHIEGEHIIGSLLLLNDTAATNLADKSDEQIITIIAHELGHAIGLGHSSDQSNLMYYKFNENQQKLGEDDIDAISYLYAINQPDILGCNSIQLTEGSSDGVIGLLIGALPLILITLLIKIKRYTDHSAAS